MTDNYLDTPTDDTPHLQFKTLPSFTDETVVDYTPHLTLDRVNKIDLSQDVPTPQEPQQQDINIDVDWYNSQVDAYNKDSKDKVQKASAKEDVDKTEYLNVVNHFNNRVLEDYNRLAKKHKLPTVNSIEEIDNEKHKQMVDLEESDYTKSENVKAERLAHKLGIKFEPFKDSHDVQVRGAQLYDNANKIIEANNASTANAYYKDINAKLTEIGMKPYASKEDAIKDRKNIQQKAHDFVTAKYKENATNVANPYETYANRPPTGGYGGDIGAVNTNQQNLIDSQIEYQRNHDKGIEDVVNVYKKGIMPTETFNAINAVSDYKYSPSDKAKLDTYVNSPIITQNIGNNLSKLNNATKVIDNSLSDANDNYNAVQHNYSSYLNRINASGIPPTEEQKAYLAEMQDKKNAQATMIKALSDAKVKADFQKLALEGEVSNTKDIIEGKYLQNIGGDLFNSTLRGVGNLIKEGSVAVASLASNMNALPLPKSVVDDAHRQTLNRISDAFGMATDAVVDFNHGIGISNATHEKVQGSIAKLVNGIAELAPTLAVASELEGLSSIKSVQTALGTSLWASTMYGESLANDLKNPKYKDVPLSEIKAMNFIPSVVAGAIMATGIKFNNSDLHSATYKIIRNMMAESAPNIGYNGVLDLAKKNVAEYIARTGSSVLSAGATGGTVSLVKDIGRNASDYLIGKKVEISPSEIFTHGLESAGQWAVMGLAMSAIPTAVAIHTENKVDAQQFGLALDMVQTPTRLSYLTSKVKDDVTNRRIDKTEAELQMASLKSLYEVGKQIPSHLVPEAKMEAFKLLREKNVLEKQIGGLNEILSTPMRERVKEIDSKLLEISKDPNSYVKPTINAKQGRMIVGNETKPTEEVKTEKTNPKTEDVQDSSNIAITNNTIPNGKIQEANAQTNKGQNVLDENGKAEDNASANPKDVSVKTFRVGKPKGDFTFSSKTEDYANEYNSMIGGKGEAKEHIVKAKNPLEVELSHDDFTDYNAQLPILEKAKADGHDLVIFKPEKESGWNGEEFYVEIKQPTQEKPSANPTKDEAKPKPTKVKVLGKEVNMYNDYIPSKVEDVETDAMYSFNADSKSGIPSLLHGVAYANKSEVNGVKKENWHASISGDELIKLYPKDEAVTPKDVVEAKTDVPKETSNVGSIINSDVDLKGEKKQVAYLFDKNEFINRIKKAVDDKKMYLDISTKKDSIGRYSVTLRQKSNDKVIGSTWVITESKGDILGKKELAEKGIPLIAESMHNDSVDLAIKNNDFIDSVNEGKMTANDAKSIIESAGLEVPKDILELSKNESKVNVVDGKQSPINETAKVEQPKVDVNNFADFEKIVQESKTVKEAYDKVQAIKDVPSEVSQAFKEKYDADGKLTPKQAFKKFYDEVKSAKKSKQPTKEVSPSSIDKGEAVSIPSNQESKTELTDKQKGTSKVFEEKAKKLADKFRDKLKTKPLTFKDKDGNIMPIRMNGLNFNEIIELGAKAIELSGKIADGIKKVSDHLKEQDWYKNLTQENKDAVDRQVVDYFLDVDSSTIEYPITQTSTNILNNGDISGSVVGMTRAIMKQEEINNNLTDTEKSELFQHSSDEKAWADVNKKMQDNPNLYQERVNATFEDALKGDKPKVSDDDALIALHEKVRLRVEHNDISQKIKDAELKGDDLSTIPLLLQREAIENRQAENKQFIKLITSSGGKLLRSARLLSGEDFTFSGLTHDIEKEQGFPLDEEQQKKYRKLADEHEALTKQMTELQNRIRADEETRTKNEEADRKKFEDETIARIKAELAKGKKQPSKPVRTKEVIKLELDKARAKLRIDLAQMSSGGLQAVESFVKVVKLAVELNIKNASAFLKEFKADLNGYSDKEIIDAYNKIANSNSFESLTDKAVELSGGELHEGMKGTIDKMLRAVVEENPEITHVEATDKIFNALNEQLPDISRDEVRDLISGYGKYKLLSKEQVDTTIREIKTQNRLDAALDAVKGKNELPLRTGMERHGKTDATRIKEAEILKIIKEKGLTPDLSEEDIAKQYKSAEETYQKRIENAISDIEREIETGERKKKANPKEYNSERTKELKADLERLKEIRDAKFSETPKTAGEKKIESLRNKIDEITQRVVSTKETKGVEISDSDLKTIKDLQDELYQAKQEAGLIKGKDFKTEAEKRTESEKTKLENLKSKLDDLLAGKVRDKKVSEPDSKEVKDLKEQIKAIEHPPKTEAEKKSAKENAKVKATEKAIADIQNEIDLLKKGNTPTGEPTVKTKDGKQIFDFKKKQSDKITNDRIKELEIIKKNLQDAKSNLIPSEIKKQAIIAKERTNRQRRLDALENQVREKKYSPKPKPEAKPYDAKVEETNLKIKKLESIVANDKEKIRLAKRGKVERMIEGMSKVHRFMIFTNPFGMGKLSLAALYRPALRVPVEFAKYSLSKLPLTRRIMKQSPGMYRPTIESAVNATKNYYAAYIAKKTFNDAVSEFNRRSNYSLLNDGKAIDRYQDKVDFAMAAPEMSHGFMKAFPKISAHISTYIAALENLGNSIDIRTGKLYDVTDPRVRQIAIEEAQREAYADVFMQSAEFSKLSSQMLTGMASSKNILLQIAGLYGKQLQPVLKVPANFYHEVMQQIPAVGMMDAAQIVYRSGDSNVKGGINNLTPDQAHQAARAMVNQAVGIMMVGIGAGLYAWKKDEAIKKIEDYKYWLHNTGLPLIMMGLRMGKDVEGGENIVKSLGKESVHTTIDETLKLPQYKASVQVTKLGWAAARAAAGKSNWDGASKQAKEMLATLLIPAGAAELAKRMDDNKKRDPKTFAEILKMRIPGLRETVGGGDIFTDTDKAKPVIKYFADKGAEFPTLEDLGSHPIDDEAVRKQMNISEYSPELQKQYANMYKVQLVRSLAAIKSQNVVFVNDYDKDDVAFNRPKKSHFKVVPIDKLDSKQLTKVMGIAKSEARTFADEQVFNMGSEIKDRIRRSGK